MTTLDLEAEDFLVSLESYLDTSPGQDIEPLSVLSSQLTQPQKVGNNSRVENIARLLGTAVGKHREWQTPFRETGLLTHAIGRLESRSITNDLAKQYLRVIGNSVADNDENRDLVLHRLWNFRALLPYLEEEDCTATVLGVLLNLCNDYDPAQVRTAELRIDIIIAEHLAEKIVPKEAMELATELITWTTDKLTQTQLESDASIKVFKNILELALQFDEDQYQDYVSILVHYLQSPDFQEKVAKPDIFKRLVDLMFGLESRVEIHELDQVHRVLGTKLDASQQFSDNIDVLLLAQLINSLSAMSSSDAFIQNFTISDPSISTLLSRFSRFDLSTKAEPSIICACIIFGNLATSDPVCEALVQSHHLHKYIIQRILIRNDSEPASLYAAAALLRHLSFPEKNRSELAHFGRLDLYCSLINPDRDPSVRGEVAAILGKLMSNNVGNVALVMNRKLSDMSRVDLGSKRMELEDGHLIDYIVAQALAPTKPVPSTSMKNAPIELGRTVVNVLRTLGQKSTEHDVAELSRQLFNVSLIARSVAQLVRQRFFAEARSEGLLGLGLMAQSQEGAACVAAELQEDSGLLQAIRELAVDQDGGGQKAAQGLRRNQQNTLVLLHGLLKNGVDEMDVELKDGIEKLVKDLGADIV